MQASVKKNGSAKPGKRAGVSRTTQRRFVFPSKKVKGSDLPGEWSAGMMLFPRKTLRVKRRSLDLMSSGQWEKARDLLKDGYVIGFIAFEHELATVVSEAVQELKMPVIVEADLEDSMVYIAHKPGR